MNFTLTQRLYRYALMCGLVVTRWRRLREPALWVELQRQIHETGIAALPVVCTLAAITGAAAVSQVTALAGQGSDAAQSWLFYGLFFEIGPLFTGLVLVARTSAAMASELAVMHWHDEFAALQGRGVSPADFLLLPRIMGLVLVAPAVSIFFQIVAVGSGWLAVSVLQHLPIVEVASEFLANAQPELVLVSLVKSAVMGLLIGVIACHHGSSGEPKPRAISEAAIHAVGNGLVAVFMVDLVFALAAYGLK
jgi:phospholipid/cholesterol/gamma-HCH transport system permease protein